MISLPVKFSSHAPGPCSVMDVLHVPSTIELSGTNIYPTLCYGLEKAIASIADLGAGILESVGSTNMRACLNTC